MRKARPCLVVVSVVLFACLGRAAGDEAATDVEKLSGTWVATAVEDYGQKAPEDQVKNLRLLFAGEEFRALHGDVSVMSGSFSVDPAKKPKTIDLKSTAGRHSGRTLEGLYELDGDTLKICFVEPAGQRPKELSSTLDNAAFLMVCRREKP